MSADFDALTTIKQVLVMHLLRQQVEADIVQLQHLPLLLADCYIVWLSHIHSHLLASIADLKRELRRHGVRIIQQQKNSLDFQIAYLEKGYQVQHCFLLATLQAEAQVLFVNLLNRES